MQDKHITTAITRTFAYHPKARSDIGVTRISNSLTEITFAQGNKLIRLNLDNATIALLVATALSVPVLTEEPTHG